MRGFGFSMRVAILALAALVTVTLPAFATDGVLRRGTGSEPDTVDPHLSVGASAAPVIYDLFLGLMTVDVEGRPVPGAATGCSASTDGLTWTCKLREGLTWSDGKPITAEDFVWSFRRLMQPETAARYASFFYVLRGGVAVNKGGAPGQALGVAAPDASTIVFTLTQPAPYFPDLLASNAAMPVPRHVVEASGKEWTKPGTMVSNGAYVLKEWVPQTKLVLAKNSAFYDAANVKVETVEFLPTENLGTALKQFRAGELDVALNVPPDQIDWIRENLPDALKLTETRGLYYYLINNTKPPFDDVRVRRALNLAIDREVLTSKLLDTGVIPAYTAVPKTINDYASPQPDWAAKPYKERIAEAKALIAEAGFGPEKPLALTVRYDTLEENRKIAVAISGMWKAIGVEATPEASEFRGVVRDVTSGNYQIARYQWFAPFDDASTFLAFYASGRTGANFSGYSNPAFDELFKQAEGTADTVQRRQLMEQAEALANADFPIIPIYFTAGRRLIQPWVQGWSENPRNANLSRYVSLAK